MNVTLAVLREPLQELLSRFAYVDLEVREDNGAPAAAFKLCAQVGCGDARRFSVTLLVTPELARVCANGFMGLKETTDTQQADVVRELANVLAGSIHDILRGGQPPGRIGPPFLLDAQEAQRLWNSAKEDARLLLRDEEMAQGGILIVQDEAWTAKWE